LQRSGSTSSISDGVFERKPDPHLARVNSGAREENASKKGSGRGSEGAAGFAAALVPGVPLRARPSHVMQLTGRVEPFAKPINFAAIDGYRFAQPISPLFEREA
jgi:hypothetical protein